MSSALMHIGTAQAHKCAKVTII